MAHGAARVHVAFLQEHSFVKVRRARSLAFTAWHDTNTDQAAISPDRTREPNFAEENTAACNGVPWQSTCIPCLSCLASTSSFFAISEFTYGTCCSFHWSLHCNLHPPLTSDRESPAMFFGLIPPSTSHLDILYYTFTRGAAGIALAIVTAVTAPLVVLIPLQINRISYAPKEVPWVGQESNTWWSKLKSTLLALKFERRNLEEGWEKVCRLAQKFFDNSEDNTLPLVQQQRQTFRPTFAPLAFGRPATRTRRVACSAAREHHCGFQSARRSPWLRMARFRTEQCFHSRLHRYPKRLDQTNQCLRARGSGRNPLCFRQTLLYGS